MTRTAALITVLLWGATFSFTAYSSPPLSFLEAPSPPGQQVAFHVHGADITLEKCGVAIGKELFVRFENAQDSVRLTGKPDLGQVVYQGLYEGIDAVYYGREGVLESDYIIQPGNNPDSIQLIYEGATYLEISPTGDLMIITPDGLLVERAPVTYQDINGVSVGIDSSFCLLGHNRVGFTLGPWNPEYGLVIDPQIVFSTYLGGTETDDNGDAIAVDTNGCTYVTGYTSSTNFMTTIEIPPGTKKGAYVVKLDRDGSLIYSTMIFGAQESSGIAVDDEGCAYITGTTAATNFPTTPGAFQPNRSSVSWEAFIVKLDPTGNLAYATYLGGAGTDEGEAIAVDGDGFAYITG